MTDTPEHEAKCQRCGISCHAGIELSDGRQVVLESLHCIHLDPGNMCQVYEKRFEVAPWCHHVNQAGPRDMLRHDCPYTGNNPKGKQHFSPGEYANVLPEIIELLLAKTSVDPHFSYPEFFTRMQTLDPDHTWSLKTNAVGTSSKLFRRKKNWFQRVLS